MKYRKGIFAVVYTKNQINGKVEYLILKRKKHWNGWEFVKGKIENFEMKGVAARRETIEETGQKILKIKKFNVKGSYKYNKILKDRPGLIGQTYHLFAIEVEKGKVKLDKIEHSDYKWVGFKEAMKKLTWKNQQECLKKVNNWLVKKKE